VPNDEPPIPQSFPSTRWTLIAKASDDDEGKREAALEELCQIYWPPIYTFIRSKGATVVEAEDLTQGFFADFLERADFAKPQSERGKLRTFLLASVRNFMINDWRNRNRLKRGGNVEIISLDGALDDRNRTGVCLLEPNDELTPQALFDRQWALTLLAEVLRSLRVQYEAKNQTELFEKLKHVVQTEVEGATYAEIAADLGMTEAAIKVAVYRMRKRYASLLRKKIADTLLETEDVEEELRSLMAAFG